VGIDLKRLIRLITDRAHEIFCIDCVGAYSRAIPCAERSAVFHTLTKCGSKSQPYTIRRPKNKNRRDEGGFP
jgi:hypothetical protein